MKKSYFLVSKPLQYVNATNIADDNAKVCVFINNMCNGLSIFKELKKQSSHWDEILFFENRMNALREMVNRKDIIENLYLDTDYGFIIQNQLSKIKANMFVYEEGVGTYRRYLRRKSLLNQLVGQFNRLLGNFDYIGGYRYTKGVYIYDEARHKLVITNFNKLRLQFNRPFIEHLKYLPEVNVFFPTVVKDGLHILKDKKVVIYITAWRINQHAFSQLKNFDGHIKILKPHPNLKEIKEYQDFDLVVDAYVLLELLMLYLVENCKEVIVIHEGSSFMQYISSRENLILINVNKG